MNMHILFIYLCILRGINQPPPPHPKKHTGSWTNVCKVWDLQQGKGSLKELCVLRGHTERVSGIAWMPLSSQEDSAQQQVR
jgi:WD40 repeat protein